MIYSSNNLQNIFGTLQKHIISSTKTSYYQHLEQQQKKPKIIAQMRAFFVRLFLHNQQHFKSQYAHIKKRKSAD